MPADSEVHRLKDILVEEVSLVDRAANKRRFLLVKRDTSMTTLKPNGRGGFTRISKADEGGGEETEEEKRAKAAGGDGKGKPPFPGAKPFPPGKGGDEETEEEKRKRIFEEESEKQRKADASGKALAEALRGHIEDLEALADELDEHEDEEPSDVHMKKLDAAHKAMGAMCEKYMSKGSKTQKRGAKMAAGRLDQYKAALATLTQILSELMDSPAKQREHEPEPGDPQGSPKGWSPTNPSGVPTGTAGTAGGFVGKRAPSGEDVLAMLQKALAPSIAKLDEMHTAFERDQRRPSGSNSAIVEKNGRRGASGGGNVSWPMDMNRELSRDKVGKDVSFYDD